MQTLSVWKTLKFAVCETVKFSACQRTILNHDSVGCLTKTDFTDP